MTATARHVIDDTERIRPHVRLCHHILREGLASRFTAVEFNAAPGATPSARAQSDGAWKDFMAFPPPVYGMLVEHLKDMAGFAPEAREAVGTILVRVAGRDASLTLRVRRNEQGSDEGTVAFPSTPVGKAEQPGR